MPIGFAETDGAGFAEADGAGFAEADGAGFAEADGEGFSEAFGYQVKKEEESARSETNPRRMYRGWAQLFLTQSKGGARLFSEREEGSCEARPIVDRRWTRLSPFADWKERSFETRPILLST